MGVLHLGELSTEFVEIYNGFGESKNFKMKSDHNLQVIIMSPPLTTHHSPAPAEQAILLSHHVQKALSEGHCTLTCWQQLAILKIIDQDLH